jgi:hypothetical protein
MCAAACTVQEVQQLLLFLMWDASRFSRCMLDTLLDCFKKWRPEDLVNAEEVCADSPVSVCPRDKVGIGYIF